MNRLKARISMISVLTFTLAQSPLTYADPTPSSTPTSTFSNCNTACTQYHNDKNTAASECSTVSANNPEVINNGEVYSNTSTCLSDMKVRWGVVGEYCDGMSAMNTAKGLVITSATLYSAVAAVCWAACGGFAAAAIPCGLGSATATAYDLAASIAVTIEGQNSTNFWKSQLDGTNWGGAVAGGAGTATAEYSIRNRSGRAGACVTAALFSAAAAIKGANIAVIKNIHDNTCSNIEKLPAIAPTGTSGNNNSAPPPLTLSAVGGGTGVGGQTSASLSPTQLGTAPGQSFPSGLMSSAATAAPLNSIIGNMPNLAQIPSALSQMGTSLGNLANQLQSGASAGSAIGSALPSNMPSGLASALSKLDDAAKKGKINIDGMKSDIPSTYSSSTKVASADEPNPFALGRGTASVSGPTGTKETSFTSVDKGSTQAIPSDGDIWHSKWNGSIFDVISNQLNQQKGQLDQLEWETPLNRALMGLPKKKVAE